MIIRDWNTALILGAISSATAPAATVEVLDEYGAKGPLTTSLLAVIGLDDAVSLVLFFLMAGFVEGNLAGANGISIASIMMLPLIEVGGSIALGVVCGLILDHILRGMKGRRDALALSIGFVLLTVGLAISLNFSLILSTIVLGIVLVNRFPEHGQKISYTVDQAGSVIYVLFFALIGARLQISLLPSMGLIGVAYLVLRSSGKFLGAKAGGIIGGALPTVRDNLGLGLLSQAGVAIGLAIDSASRFPK